MIPKSQLYCTSPEVRSFFSFHATRRALKNKNINLFPEAGVKRDYMVIVYTGVAGFVCSPSTGVWWAWHGAGKQYPNSDKHQGSPQYTSFLAIRRRNFKIGPRASLCTVGGQADILKITMSLWSAPLRRLVSHEIILLSPCRRKAWKSPVRSEAPANTNLRIDIL